MAERASFWTAIGAMAIPLGVVVLQIGGLLFPWSMIALILFGGGIFSIISGWGYLRAEEKRREKEEKQRDEEHQLTIRREKGFFILLTKTAEQLGVDLGETAKIMEQHLDDK